jgi:hypothetical protein
VYGGEGGGPWGTGRGRHRDDPWHPAATGVKGARTVMYNTGSRAPDRRIA